MPDSFLSPPAIINRVIGLHRSDDLVASKTRNVLHAQMLSMLDAKATIPIKVFFLNLFVDRKNSVVRAIANSVNDHLQTGAIGAAHAFEHRARRKHFLARNATGVRRIVVWFEEEGCG